MFSGVPSGGLFAVHLIYHYIPGQWASLEPFLLMVTFMNNKYYNNNVVHAKFTNC
jgi:hypothetical protein